MSLQLKIPCWTITDAIRSVMAESFAIHKLTTSHQKAAIAIFLEKDDALNFIAKEKLSTKTPAMFDDWGVFVDLLERLKTQGLEVVRVFSRTANGVEPVEFAIADFLESVRRTIDPMPARENLGQG